MPVFSQSFILADLIIIEDAMKKHESNAQRVEEATPAPAAENAEPVATIGPATLAPEQLEELKERAARADEFWDRLLRTTADFDNFKKRAARERTEAIQFANAALIQKLLPVLDSFEMALAASQTAADEKSASLQAGIVMVQSQLKNVLADAGLEEIDATARPFDPALHEAVSQQESGDAAEGQVIQQIRKGYKWRERLLRPAAVIVAKKPSGKGK